MAIIDSILQDKVLIKFQIECLVVWKSLWTTKTGNLAIKQKYWDHKS